MPSTLQKEQYKLQKMFRFSISMSFKADRPEKFWKTEQVCPYMRSMHRNPNYEGHWHDEHKTFNKKLYLDRAGEKGVRITNKLRKSPWSNRKMQCRWYWYRVDLLHRQCKWLQLEWLVFNVIGRVTRTFCYILLVCDIWSLFVRWLASIASINSVTHELLSFTARSALRKCSSSHRPIGRSSRALNSNAIERLLEGYHFLES